MKIKHYLNRFQQRIQKANIKCADFGEDGRAILIETEKALTKEERELLRAFFILEKNHDPRAKEIMFQIKY